MEKIDLVIPYVDSLDPKWIELYNKYNNLEEKNAEINGISRFRGQGDFFKYMFRCIEKNMPWINNVFLVVQSESQVPQWLNKDKVTIVTHEQFIPSELLPLFNSTAIEMFIWNIPGLSEQFLYTNDDIIPVGPLTPQHFFEDGKCKTNGRFVYDIKSMYGHHIVNSYELVYERKNNLVGCCIGFSHLIRPLLRSKCKECFEKYKDKILASITKFRDTKNYNVYIYDNYMIRNTTTLPRLGIIARTIRGDLSYKEINSKLSNIGKSFNIINICDASDDVNVYDNESLKRIFREHYSFKSKYEI